MDINNIMTYIFKHFLKKYYLFEKKPCHEECIARQSVCWLRIGNLKINLMHKVVCIAINAI